MARAPWQVFHFNWVPHTWIDAVQAAAWIALAMALVPLVLPAGRVLRERHTRNRALLIAGAALLARLLVPLLPFNWHSGVMNVDLGAPIYSKDTTFMSLPNQLITFTWGFYGILIFNILTSTASAVLAWYVARRAGYGARVALLLGLAIAVTPMYVRLSSSDSTHMLALPLWWVAALATQRLVSGRGGRADQIVLFTSAVVACPIRIEAGLVMPSVVLFVARDLEGLRQVWQARYRWYPLILGVLLGMACNVAFHASSWRYRLAQFDPIVFVIQLTARVLFLASPDPFGWIPILYVLLIWYYVWFRWRTGDRAEVAATVLPFVIFSVPYVYSATAIATELPATAYGITIDMFLLLGAAKGAALLYERLQSGALPLRASLRAPAAGAGLLLLLGSFVIPYRKTYAYMEEFAFLSRALPRGKAKILAIWDPDSAGGDYDCCLALPYPTFVGDFPELEWQILSRADADPERLKNIDFEYYYPGSLVAVDVENLNSWFIGRLFPDTEMNAQQKAQLQTLRSIDAAVRSAYPLEPVRSETLPAHTFSWAPFSDDRMTLTLYRRVGGDPAWTAGAP